MAAQGFSIRRRQVSQRGIATAETVIGILVAVLGAVLGYLVLEVKQVSSDYQADYRSLRDKIEATNNTIKDALNDTAKQQVEFKATISAKLESLSDAVEKKKSR